MAKYFEYKIVNAPLKMFCNGYEYITCTLGTDTATMLELTFIVWSLFGITRLEEMMPHCNPRDKIVYSITNAGIFFLAHLEQQGLIFIDIMLKNSSIMSIILKTIFYVIVACAFNNKVIWHPIQLYFFEITRSLR